MNALGWLWFFLAGMRLSAARVIAALVMIVWLVWFALSAAPAHADPQPALDRQLVERMTRALEAQASATRDLVRATERCGR